MVVVRARGEREIVGLLLLLLLSYCAGGAGDAL